jgi:hypothetical protein
LQQRADAALLDALVPQADVVLDCSDNFETRHAINAACVRHRVPLVYKALLGRKVIRAREASLVIREKMVILVIRVPLVYKALLGRKVILVHEASLVILDKMVILVILAPLVKTVNKVRLEKEEILGLRVFLVRMV